MAKSDEPSTQEIAKTAATAAARETAQKQKIKMLEKAEKLANRAKNFATNQLEIVQREPNLPQLLVAGTATVVGAFAAYKAVGLIEEKTVEWKDEEGNDTTWRKVVVHGLFPTVGALGIVGGCFMRNGLVAAGIIGTSVGLLLGSLLKSVMKDEDKP